MNKKTIVSISLLLFGFLMIANLFTKFYFTFYEITAITFLFYGISSIFYGFKIGNRGVIFLASITFLSGVFLLILENARLINTRGIYLTGSLFILGSSLLMLFIYDSKIKQFLWISLTLIALSNASIFLIDINFIKSAIEFTDRIMSVIYPYFLIALGLFLLTGSFTRE
ncbi:MAG: hypothetical protein RBS48_01110 [Ignavibacteriaceae bacterium]|jgi:hypothetical protein|nr:hypothetical protein [Ignavibacteriaceae bacterium]